MLCPQCFGDNPAAEIGFISLDGNFQHKRFPTKKDADDTYLELRDQRLFIDDGIMPDDIVSCHILHFSDLSKSQPKDEINIICARNFTAAAEKKIKSKAIVDTGIMAVICRCGIPLRLYNIRRTGERAIYGARLVKNVLEDGSCPPKLMFSYDINCRFSKYIKVDT